MPLRLPSWPRPRTRRLVIWFQLVVGLVAFLGGAALIGIWALGLAIVLVGVALIGDAVLRDDGADRAALRTLGAKTHDQVIEEYRRAP